MTTVEVSSNNFVMQSKNLRPGINVGGCTSPPTRVADERCCDNLESESSLCARRRDKPDTALAVAPPADAIELDTLRGRRGNEEVPAATIRATDGENRLERVGAEPVLFEDRRVSHQ